MIKQIRTSKISRVICCYLALMIFIQVTQPLQIYALTSGPTQPEFNSFTPIGTSDMVNLSSGDFNYNIPIMDVGGYPINLAYDSGITMDQEASWVGLGWNLNVGQIKRQVRGLPDDFKGGIDGDIMNYQDDIKENWTVGTNVNVQPAIFGAEPVSVGIGLGASYNNYDGVTFTPSISASYKISENVQVGVSLSGSDTEGASVNPSVSLSGKKTFNDNFGVGLSAGYNSRKGLENFTMSVSGKYRDADGKGRSTSLHQGSLSFNAQNYTPTQRVGYLSHNQTFDGSIGVTVFGVDVDLQMTGYGVTQVIHPLYKNRNIFAYGYDYTHHKYSVLGNVTDFNREKEQVFNKHTAALPTTNYTYDIYNIDGQGIGGTFRPHHSQVGVVYNDVVYDGSLSSSFGAEVGFAQTFHAGADFKGTYSTTTTGPWLGNNNTLLNFSESTFDANNPLYEAVFFKTVGEMNVDEDSGYGAQLKGESPIQLGLGGGYWNRKLMPKYQTKVYPGGILPPVYPETYLNGKIKRSKRLKRNQSVQKISKKEANSLFFDINSKAKDHHTAGFKVLQPNGTTYIYGKAVYNTKKIEATFDVSGKTGDINTGLVGYTPNVNGSVDGTSNGSTGSDSFLNKITTPEHAHSYLITSILSADYEDYNNNGLDINDLGSYTKFTYYTSKPLYKWRTPYQKDTASFNEGFKTSVKDQRGSYIYGEKELIYINTIETKTHIAYFELVDREDALPVKAENGGQDASTNNRMQRIKSIQLYSRPELLAAGIITSSGTFLQNPTNNVLVKPIKTAHFEYDYTLCKQAPSSLNNSGKLTLKRVYFTYGDSNMGKYTPYKFDYGTTSAENPPYDMKGFDIWGNYKPNDTSLNNTDFPFVTQNKSTANQYATAWVLKKITLPSGGEIKITTESDDYQYVQNRKAMQMYKVIGAGNIDAGQTIPTRATLKSKSWSSLYSGEKHSQYLYLDLGVNNNKTSKEFVNQYLSENLNKPIYFKFNVNMTPNPNHYDYVEGYCMLDVALLTNPNLDLISNEGIAAIPVKFVNRGRSAKDVNPISKAGWGFARSYLSKIAYSKDNVEEVRSFSEMVKNLAGSISSVGEMFKGPNRILETKGCASVFITNESWIRLETPNGRKYGGGSRVQKVELSDNWDVMNGFRAENSPITDPLYHEYYGQEYSYTLDDEEKTSSGVASYEPNASHENPFVEPFYGATPTFLEKLASPKDQNYVELPLGEGFFPAATVTYSRVTVSNLKKDNDNGNLKVKKHATGKVVTEYYTTKDYPTKADFTKLEPKDDSPFLNIFLKSTRKHMTATQGFSIVTNDMNGKEKSTSVYQQAGIRPISVVEYKYSTDDKGNLDNNLITIDEQGNVQKKQIAVDIDVINDINESKSVTKSSGVDTNLAMFLVAIFPAFIPVPIPSYSRHEMQLRTATTTKVVHQTGVMVEKTAYDLGSKVSTKNKAWDANTGEVLLTETINEFDDKYYTFSYPAYWKYENMGLASDNLGMSGYLSSPSITEKGVYKIVGTSENDKMDNYFKKGDEIIVTNAQVNNLFQVVKTDTHYWVTDFSADKKYIKLIDRFGKAINDILFFTTINLNAYSVVRSGNRNQQNATMASVTSTVNPIDTNNDNVLEPITGQTFVYGANATTFRVINASAVEYSDDWKGVCENGINTKNMTYNPYLFNIKGDWRAVKSYAYLSGRVATNGSNVNRRTAGYYTNFAPFYQLGTDKKWQIKGSDWTFASEVTKHSPYGVELENKDALGRYSSAQYGYNYTLPTAVSSNTQYMEMGADNFEDYPSDVSPTSNNPHFRFSENLSNQTQGNTSIIITKEASHTGNKSLKVRPGASATFKRKIDGCVYDPVPTTY